jgi:hypothetical protein
MTRIALDRLFWCGSPCFDCRVSDFEAFDDFSDFSALDEFGLVFSSDFADFSDSGD